jgi:AraC family transcriptional regulator
MTMTTAPHREILVDAATGARHPVFADDPELESDPKAWPSIHVEQRRFGAHERGPVLPLNHLLVVHLDGASDIEVADNGTFRLYRVLPGHVSLFPAGSVFASRTRSSGRFYSVSLTSQFVANHGMPPESDVLPELVPVRAVMDGVVKALCDRIRDEVIARHPDGRFYVESLGAALAAHLTRNYLKPAVSSTAGNGRGLTPNQLRKAVEFMRDRLGQDLPLEAIAKAAGLSAFHFARRFKVATGYAPHQYLIRQRIDRARHLLVHTKVSLVEVAHQCGFCDQSHLTNHFRRVTGMTPRRFRNRESE